MKVKAKLLQLLDRDSFTKNFIFLLSGGMAGQVINVLASPILTRIFSPAEFGYFGVFNSMVSIITGVTVLKLERALPLKESKEEYNELFWFCLLINTAICAFITLIFSLIPFEIYQVLNIEEIYSLWWLFGLAILLTGTNRIFNSAVVRFKAFKAIATSFLNQVIVKNGFQIGVGYYYPTSLVLILGNIVNQITSSVNLIRVIKRNKMVGNPVFSFQSFRQIIRSHKDYVVYGTPSGLTNTLGLYLPVPLVMFFYGPEAAGALSFSITLISLPMRVIGNSISQVFVGESAELIRTRKDGLSQLYDNISKRLALFIVIPMAIVLFFGKYLFGFVFGNEWIMAGEFTQVLIVCYALQFVASPLSQILNLLVMQRVQLIWDLFRLIITVVSLVIPVHLGYGVDLAILYFTVGMSISYLALIVVCRFCISRYENNIAFKENNDSAL